MVGLGDDFTGSFTGFVLSVLEVPTTSDGLLDSSTSFLLFVSLVSP